MARAERSDPNGGRGASGSGSFEAAFRNHYEEHYAGAGARYEMYRPAYFHGRALARESGLPRPSLRRGPPALRSTLPGTPLHQVREAMQHAYEREQTSF